MLNKFEMMIPKVPDSYVLTVTLEPPVVILMEDANVNVRDSITITANAADNGNIKKFLWTKNGSAYNDTTKTGSFNNGKPESLFRKTANS